MFRISVRAIAPNVASASTSAAAGRPAVRARSPGARAGASARAGAGAGTATAAASFFTWSGSNNAGKADGSQGGNSGWVSKSGFLRREASPAMAEIKKQAYTLVFLSSPNLDADKDKNSRKRWGAVLGYFQESSGYDALDLTVAAERGDGASAGDQHEDLLVLADELHAQLRLAFLQRPPIIFASAPSSKILSAYISPDCKSTPLLSGAIITLPPAAAANFRTSSSPSEVLSSSALPSSGGTTASFKAPVLVVLPGTGGGDHDTKALEAKVRELWGPKASLLRVDSNDPHSAEALRDVERWMIAQGF